MEKLIKLLNEYDNNNWWVTDYWALFNRMNEWISDAEDLQVISKKFWFIERLVKNDKINKNYSEWLPAITKNWFLMEWETALLMILSIQDNPIEYLCSILK